MTTTTTEETTVTASRSYARTAHDPLVVRKIEDHGWIIDDTIVDYLDMRPGRFGPFASRDLALDALATIRWESTQLAERELMDACPMPGHSGHAPSRAEIRNRVLTVVCGCGDPVFIRPATDEDRRIVDAAFAARSALRQRGL